MISFRDEAASDGSAPRAVWKVSLLPDDSLESLGRERRRWRALSLRVTGSCSSDCYCRETAVYCCCEEDISMSAVNYASIRCATKVKVLRSAVDNLYLLKIECSSTAGATQPLL